MLFVCSAVGIVLKDQFEVFAAETYAESNDPMSMHDAFQGGAPISGSAQGELGEQLPS